MTEQGKVWEVLARDTNAYEPRHLHVANNGEIVLEVLAPRADESEPARTLVRVLVQVTEAPVAGGVSVKVTGERVLREAGDGVTQTRVRIVQRGGPNGPTEMYFVESVPVQQDGSIAEYDEYQVIAIGPHGPEARFATLEGANGFVDAMLAFDASQPIGDYDETAFWDLVEAWEGR